jgi:alkylmercury lyase
MSVPDIPSPDAYWEGLRPHLRPFSPDERHAAVALYRELAKGQAVADAQLAHALGISIVQSRALLQRDAIKPFIYRDREGRVLGFGGLATTPMHHRFEVDGHELSTWCAWDSLFIPEILGRSARVASLDPDSGETVRLFVTPERIESIEPKEAVISFHLARCTGLHRVGRQRDGKVLSFHIFFASRPSGERWVNKNPGTFLYSLDDAFALAKRLNAYNFGAELSR